MRTKKYLFSAVASLAAAMFVSRVSGDEKQPTNPKPTEAKQTEEPKKAEAGKQEPSAAAEMWAEWEKMNQPGEHHEHLKPLVGSWKCTLRIWAPNQPPSEHSGTIERKAVLGGRYVQEEFNGTMEGKPFSGIGFMGYDTLKQKHVASWMDSMSTGITTMIGSCDPSGKVFTMESTEVNPMTQAKDKSVLRIINNDKHVFEMFAPGPDGKEYKSFEMECTRK